MPPKNPDPESAPSTVHTLHLDGATYESRLVCCNKPACKPCNRDGRRRPTHGPYWYLCYTWRGKTRRKYLGKHLDTSLYRDQNGRINLAMVRAPRLNPPPVDPAAIAARSTPELESSPPPDPSPNPHRRFHRLLDFFNGSPKPQDPHHA